MFSSQLTKSVILSLIFCFIEGKGQRQINKRWVSINQLINQTSDGCGSAISFLNPYLEK